MPKELVVVVHGVGVREAGVTADLLSLALDHDEEREAQVQRRRRAPSGGSGPVPFGAEASGLPAPGRQWVPVTSDDFHLREPQRYRSGALHATFGARLRRYRCDAAEGRRDRVVADFYWGDISGTGGDLWRVLLGFVKIVLGLAHVLRENAQSVWPGGKGADPWMRRLASLAALVLHGPVLALNLILLGGVGVTWAAEALGRAAVAAGLADPAAWQPVALAVAAALAAGAVLVQRRLAGLASRILRSSLLAAGLLVLLALAGIALFLAVADVRISIGLAAIAAGWAAGARAYAYLLRHLADWMMIGGVLVLVLIPLEGWPLTSLARAGSGLCSLPDGAACAPPWPQVYQLGSWLLGLTVAFWGAAIAAGLVLWLAGALRRRDPMAPEAPVDLLAAVIGLMTMLAFILIAAVWGTVRSLLPASAAVEQALALSLPAVLVLGLAVLASGLVFLRSGAERLKRPSDYLRGGFGPDRRAERHRLIVARPVLALCRGFLVLLALLLAVEILADMPGVGNRLQDPLKAINGWMQGQSGTVLALMAGAAALAVGVLRAPLATGIGIATDVIVYLNSYGWPKPPAAGQMPGDAGGPEAPDGGGPAPAAGTAPAAAGLADGSTGRTLLERAGLGWLGRSWLAPAAGEDRPPHGYWLRERIQDRLRTLLEALLRNEAPDRLCIVSHSQGTVIALDVIARLDGLTLPGGGVRLVTMGSPYTHIYHRFFPRAFPSHRRRAPLLPDAEGGRLVGWVNLFRVDDFVGTHIDAPRNRALGGPPGAWPREVALPRGGHTMYWIDGEAYAPLRAAVAGRMDGPGKP